MQGNGNPGGDLNEIRLILAEVAAGQARHEHILEEYSRRHNEAMAAVDVRLDRMSERQERIEERQERIEESLERTEESLERTARHLEVHSLLIDDLIRNKQDRKKRA